MLSFKRFSVVTLLTGLLVGHVALALHIATHEPIDQNSCEFCAGHASPAIAAPPALLIAPPVTIFVTQPVSVEAAVSASTPKFYRERAPPESV